MRNKLRVAAVQRQTTVDEMMEGMLTEGKSIRAIAKELDVATGSVRYWLHTHHYRAVEMVFVTWVKGDDNGQ